jgi:iron complex transport system ATP-binding protein
MTVKSNISLKDADLGYNGLSGEIKVLQKLNLAFFPGEFIAVVGVNGTGKSTLLRSMCGLLPLLNGKVLLNETEINELSFTEIAKAVSIVLTEKIGGFNLNVFDAVAAGQIPYTDSFHRLRDDNKIIINDAINTVGLNNHAHKLLHELSDGLFQKTMIAKALAQQTPSILLDEPSAYLDYSSKHELFLLLKKLSEKEKKCILVSTHDLDLALKYCMRLLVVVSNGTAELIDVTEARMNAAFNTIAGGFI